MDAVVHLAAAGSVIHVDRRPCGEFRRERAGHVPGARRRPAGRVERTVQASTGGALIGNATPPVDESSLPKPISPYGASKLAGEGYAHAFATSYGPPHDRAAGSRTSTARGARRSRGVITNVLLRAIRAGEPLVIYGDGSASRDYTHADDIARAIGLALDTDVPGGTVLHIASGVETTATRAGPLVPGRRRARRIIQSSTGPRGPARWNATSRSYDLASNDARLRAEHRREDGIRRTWQWFTDAVPASLTAPLAGGRCGPARDAGRRLGRRDGGLW